MEAQTHVAVMHFEFFFPDAHSLKEKRMILRRLKDGLGTRFNVSVAEVGFQDLWQRSLLAAAMVSNSRASVEQQSARVIQEVEQIAPSELVRHHVEYW